jgi:hypothetical protein
MIFSRGLDRQKLYLPAEVSRPDGDFDTLGIFYSNSMNFSIKILILALQRP